MQKKEVYEEMQRTSFEIKNGMGEDQSLLLILSFLLYERFGERYREWTVCSGISDGIMG